ncbi:DUF1109 domain-containing protein [Brevundimonas sp. BAL450]|uniref:NrsF family protein n=2 Tax=Brevundimonas TaxID=41275 RepID=UPI0018C97834|nr:DUF1109 domain-containing protein [Brevundimonas sp. BAL450]MBG7615904.1 DUF1109 domain-containing protein [Brevundimonas sp. BAL450]
MKTDDLIDALGAGLEPVGPARLSPAALTLAAAAAVVAVLFLLGLRPDLGAAVQGPAFWAKAAYTGALAVVGGWLVLRLGCPGASARPPGLAFAAVVGAALAVGAGEILLSAPDARMDVWLGDTWRYCSANILKVSVFAAPFIWLSARGLAPTRPVRAGAAMGVLTGAVGATAYGLHCPEATAAFVATWYALGVLLCGAVGALTGRYALRW